MVVDDSESDRVSFARAYKRIAPDQELLQCASASEALETIANRLEADTGTRPALAIVDVNMPERDGLDLLDDIRRAHPWMPVVIMSGSARAVDLDRAYASGVAGFFVKPMGLDELAQIVDAIDRYWLRHSALPDPTGRSFGR